MAPHRMNRPRLRLVQIEHAVPSRDGVGAERKLFDMNDPTDAHARVGN